VSLVSNRQRNFVIPSRRLDEFFVSRPICFYSRPSLFYPWPRSHGTLAGSGLDRDDFAWTKGPRKPGHRAILEKITRINLALPLPSPPSPNPVGWTALFFAFFRSGRLGNMAQHKNWRTNPREGESTMLIWLASSLFIWCRLLSPDRISRISEDRRAALLLPTSTATGLAKGE
jgi:hypothetical protein